MAFARHFCFARRMEAHPARMPLATCIGFVPRPEGLGDARVKQCVKRWQVWRLVTELKICKHHQASRYLKSVTLAILNTTLFFRGLMRQSRLCGLDVHHTLDAHRAGDFGGRAAGANNYFNCRWAKYAEASYYSKEV